MSTTTFAIIVGTIITIINVIDLLLYIHVTKKYGPQNNIWPFSGYYLLFFPDKNNLK